MPGEAPGEEEADDEAFKTFDEAEAAVEAEEAVSGGGGAPRATAVRQGSPSALGDSSSVF